MPFITTRSVGANCITSLSYRLRFREMRSHIVSAARGRPWRTYATENLHPSASSGFRSGVIILLFKTRAEWRPGCDPVSIFRNMPIVRIIILTHDAVPIRLLGIRESPGSRMCAAVDSSFIFGSAETCHGILMIAGKDEIECCASPKPDWAQPTRHNLDPFTHSSSVPGWQANFVSCARL